MTSTQTGTLMSKDGEAGYGFGFSTSRKDPGSGSAPAGDCGHGGAYSTDLHLDVKHHLVLVYMVQHAGYPNGGGNKVHAAFTKAAEEQFGSE